MGYALPAAIGAAVGKPDDPIVVIVGDYGFQYTLPELATAVELNLSLPIVLWDNGKLKEIEDQSGRRRDVPKFSARTLDIDIVLQIEDDEILFESDEIEKYSFVSDPLKEII